MTTLKLVEIAQGWDAFEAAIEQSGGELTPELEAQLHVLNLAEREKLDGYALYIRSLEEQAKSMKAIEDELAAKRRTVQNRIAWLKGRVEGHMQATDRDELRGDIYRFRLQKNGGKPPVEVFVGAEALDSRFVKVTPAIDKEALREAILAGEIHPAVARIGEVGRSLRIY